MSYVNTIADLEARTYGLTGATGFNNQLLKSNGAIAGLHAGHAGQSAGADLGTGTTAANVNALYNKIYGQKVWSMLNRECNALSIISKRPYTSSGWRIMTSRPTGGSGNFLAVSGNADNTDGDGVALAAGTGAGQIGGTTPRADGIGGVPENAKLDTVADGLVSLAPEYDTLFTSPKIIAHQFDFSELAMEMAAIDDGIGDIRAQMREDMGKHHAEVQNKMLVMPLEFYIGVDGGSTSLANLDRGYTSLLKVVSSNAEITAMATDELYTGGTAGQTVDDAVGDTMKTLYGKERGATTGYLDSQVDFGADYTAGSQADLTLAKINKMLRLLRESGGSPKVILTGYDTIQALADLLQAQERFMDRKEIVPTVNGVRGTKGQEVGFRVSTYYDIPLIPVSAMSQTGQGTATKLSDMLFLDTDHLWLSVMKPTQYFEDGISNGNPFGVGTLGNKALYRTIAEVGCSYFKGQGKITNLK
jgi:hypothetical protein